MDEEVTVSATPEADPKRDLATEIYTAWRNTHFNQIPVEIFNRLEAASKHLIEEIAAHL